MVLEHLKLLKNLLKSEIDCSKISIYYNTNGTYFPPDEVWELYSNFENITFAISIDDIDDRFTYQRHPAKWQEAKQNITKFKKTSQLHKNMRWTLDPTISVFNVYYADEIEKEFEDLGFKLSSTCEHFVTGSKFDCRNLPVGIKQQIIKKLTSNGTTPWLSNICSFLVSSASDENMFKLGLREISQIDKLRNESFKDTFKEFYKILEPYWEEYNGNE